MILATAKGGTAPRDRNLMLARLAAADRALIDPHLRDVVLAEDQRLLASGEAIPLVYFPDTVVVALEEGAGAQQRIEIAVVGYEGLVGWPALLGCTHSPHRAVVQLQGGTARCIAVAPLAAACRASPTLWPSLLAFVQGVTIQMARAIVAHLENSLDQRVARWLLMRHDRIRGDQIHVRHDQIADGLNARRASVTNRLHILEGERLIRNRRGRIDIQDRGGMEAFAGTAYGRCEADYAGLIAPFGKSPQVPAEPAMPATLAAVRG